MKALTQQIAIAVKYIGASNFKGSRISLRLPRWKKSRIIPYNHEAKDATDGAQIWLESNGIELSHIMDHYTHYVFSADWGQRQAIFKAFNIAEQE